VDESGRQQNKGEGRGLEKRAMNMWAQKKAIKSCVYLLRSSTSAGYTEVRYFAKGKGRYHRLKS
jgi:hypothetical protein